MRNLIFTLGCLCLVVAVGLAAYRRYCLMQMEVGEMVAAYRSAGIDPDVAFLRAIAEIQAQERGRWRSPVRWVAVKYVQRSRRIWMG
jgi:hypothetical protein